MGETIGGEARDLSFRPERQHLDETRSGADRPGFHRRWAFASRLAGRATHLPLLDMQTAGCAAKDLFASETSIASEAPTNM